MFLFDISGSMKDNNKIGQARDAGVAAVNEMREGGASNAPVSIITFAGPCSPASISRLMNFAPNLTQAESVMRSIRATDGATPLPQAKDAAINAMTGYLGSNLAYREGRIILLSDGQSTCGDIRPPGVFSQQRMNVVRTGESPIRFLTIGFDILPGSGAERDLQYLAFISGGRYYNAGDQVQLARALRKHVRVYRPRACNTTDADFAAGTKGFADTDYPAALGAFKRYADRNPADWCGLYNLALAYEANDRYKRAGESYTKYLSAASASPDRTKIEAKIAEMRTEYAAHLDYMIRLITSDRDYLRQFWESIFNRSSASLAEEFGGFVYEKGEFYATLPDILEIDERWLANDAQDVSSSIRVLDRRRRAGTFDIDAVSLLTTPIGQIEDMRDRLIAYRASKVR